MAKKSINVQSTELNDPELYLWDNEENRSNYQALVSLFDSDRFVSFIGAGVSKSLGIQDWEGLLRDLKKVVKQRFDVDKDIPEDSMQYPEYAEELYQLFEENTSTTIYYKELSKGMRPTNNSTSLTLVKLALAINTHLTTNFDASLEHAYGFLSYLSKKYSTKELSKNYEVRYIPQFGDYSGSENNDLIYYLHGNVSQNIYLLRKSQYEIYYPTISKIDDSSGELERLLDYYYRNKSIVFIGFSFSDFYVREYFFAKAKEIKRENLINKGFVVEAGKTYHEESIKHFLLINTNNKYFVQYGAKIFDWLQEYNIYPVIYSGDKHIFLEMIFERLG